MKNEGVGFTIDIPEDVFFAVLIGTFVLALAGVAAMMAIQLWRTWQPRHRMRAIAELSRSMNLVIPEELREPLARAVGARKRGTVIGSMIGLFGVVVAALLWARPWEDPPPDTRFGTWILFVAIAGGCTTIGAVVGGLLARRTTPATPRTARLTTLSYPDLIAPVERRIVALCVAGGVGVPAVLAIASRAPWADTQALDDFGAGLTLGAGLLAAALWLALPRISRRLVSARALPGDEHALAWSDALAARTVRDIAYLAANVSGTATVLATMALGLALPQGWQDAAGAMATITWGLALAGILTFVILVGSGSPERHVQRTLWPQFAADAQ